MIKKIIVFISSTLGAFGLMPLTLWYAILKQAAYGTGGNIIIIGTFALGGWIGASLPIFFMYKKWKLIQRLVICIAVWSPIFLYADLFKNTKGYIPILAFGLMGIFQAAIMEN